MDTSTLPRWATVLIGPELVWLLVYGAMTLLARANQPPNPRIDDFIENLWILIPALTALIFLLWFVPDVEKRGLLLRVWVAGIVGAHLALDKGMSAFSQQGPGIGTAYLVGMILVFVVLVIGSIVVFIRYR
ncbi:hypothetical protein [Spirosoma sordidisoli]|uniref:Uncharacterized protein n=1 Tax=Spirosoma sordidisoli TaxID=2502893 RepID=A0A4Q2UQD1_9BACT|nr:hypothetical protein [Spirosoma sordidisoli]RYC71734.1 hypothetical protein EQG79_06290 [Spirosoma sordidisoli]